MRLITLGGGGNIGYWVEREFLDKNHEVLSVSRGVRKVKREFPQYTPGLSFLAEDIRFPSNLLKNKVKEAEVIIDFVCFNREDANLRKSLLSEFSGIYFMVSTVAVYNRKKSLNTLSAISNCDTLAWHYARNKYEAELAIRNYQAPFKKKILRLGHTFDISLPVPFGPSDWTIPKWLLEGEPLLIHRRERSTWPLLHSIDAAKRIYFVASHPEMFLDTVNVVANATTTWKEIGLAFFKCLNLEPRFQYISPDDLRTKHTYWSDSVYFHKQFDEEYVGVEQDIFRETFPKDIDIETGLHFSLEWYLTNPEYRKVKTEALTDLSLLKL